MELDRHKLEEERRWRLRNYQAQVQRLVQMLVDAIRQEAKQVLEREIQYDDDLRDEYSYARQAGQLQHAILQAVNNADFGGLTRDAGELHAVMMGLHTLSKMKESLPAEMRLELEEREDTRLRDRIDEKVARIEELDAKKAESCVASVSEGGRSVGFHQCSFAGKHVVKVDGRPGYLGRKVEDGDPQSVEHAIEVKVCNRHLKDAEAGRLHVYRPNDWEAKEQLRWRRKEVYEIAAMRAQLAGEIVPGHVQKEIDA